MASGTAGCCSLHRQAGLASIIVQTAVSTGCFNSLCGVLDDGLGAVGRSLNVV
jgi:hypothetical protein